MPKSLKSLTRVLDRLSLALFTALAFGLVAAMLVLATPAWLFERTVIASGLPGLLAAAAPPLGATARGLSAVAAALATGSVLWGISTITGVLVRTRSESRHDSETLETFQPVMSNLEMVESMRRPIFAGSDLGAPFMSDEAIAQVRDELLLDTLAPDAEDSPELTPRTAGNGSISALLARLEAALERRERHKGSLGPVRPGDIASFHAALGASAPYH